MLKTLGAQVKEFKKDSFLTPCFMILEVLMETMIPFLMASIVDEGVNGGNISHIYRTGALMIGAALIGLWAGIMEENMEPGLRRGWLGICGTVCLKIFRHFPSAALTNTARQD